MKKLLALILAFAFLCSLIVPVCASDMSVSPVNTRMATGLFDIDDQGMATIGYSYIGDNSMESVTITIKLEKRTLLLFWNDVETWTITSTDVRCIGEIQHQLTKSGTYRCTIVYEVTSTDGTVESKEYQEKIEYDPA